MQVSMGTETLSYWGTLVLGIIKYLISLDIILNFKLMTGIKFSDCYFNENYSKARIYRYYIETLYIGIEDTISIELRFSEWYARFTSVPLKHL